MLTQITKRCMKFKGSFISTNFLLFMKYICEVLIPYVFSGFIDGIADLDSISIFSRPVLIIGALTAVLMISSFLYHVLSEVLIVKASYEFLNDIDNKLEHIPLRIIEKHNPAYLNNRIFNDILTSIGFVINNFIVSIIMIISTLVLLVLIIKVNIFLVFIPLLALIINISTIVTLNKIYYEKGYKYRDVNSQYVSDNNDRIASIKETKIHCWYDISGDQIKESFKELLKVGISLNKVVAFLNNAGNLSKNLTLILTMLVGGSLFISQKISIGQFVLITYYTNMCLSYSEYFLKLGQGYQNAKISYDRLREFLDVDDENNGSISLDGIDTVEIKNLSFSYPDSPSLFSEFNYTLKKSKIYCLKGKNGEGKSTFIDLLLGLDHSFKGAIKINNTEISSLDMIDLRKRHISVILQEPRLQRLSVRDNIKRGLKAYDVETMDELCNKLNVNKILDVTESQSLSGGEKQKVAIIRGLLKEASLLILDEPVSAMDIAGMKVLKDELVKRKENSIIIFISHNEDLFDIVDEFIEFPKFERLFIKEDGPSSLLEG